MKRTLFLCLCAVFASNTWAQDVILLKNAEEIQSKVTEVTPKSVSYKHWNNLEGPSYTISKSDIFYIKYQNGDKHVIAQNTEKNTLAKIDGYVTMGADFYSNGVGPTLDISAGVRLLDHFYVGFETGFHSLFSPYTRIYTYNDGTQRIEKGTYFDATVPIALNMKFYFTKDTKITPYISCSFGAQLGTYSDILYRVGAGLDYKRFTMCVGYSPLFFEEVHCGYVQFGIRLAK